MALEIIRNDITKMKVDAIVNTANPRPVIGAGTDSAIHQAAGPELLEARKEIGAITCGEAAVTPAFGLDATYVIHTVSPVWVDGNHHETELLRKAYNSALELAHAHHCKSVAFPLMAAGSYGFPKDVALSIAINTCNEFLLRHRVHIYLVVFNGKAYQLSRQLVADVKSYIDEHYVDDRSTIEYGCWDLEQRRRLERELFYGRRVSQDSDRLQPVCASEKTVRVGHHSLNDQLKAAQETFSDAMRRIICEKDLKDTEVYLPIRMNRTTFNKIKNTKDHRPRRDTALQLAIALHLNLDQTQDFIGKAGYTLSHSSKADIILEYCMQTDRYDPFEIDDLLVEMGEKALFSLA